MCRLVTFRQVGPLTVCEFSCQADAASSHVCRYVKEVVIAFSPEKANRYNHFHFINFMYASFAFSSESPTLRNPNV